MSPRWLHVSLIRDYCPHMDTTQLLTSAQVAERVGVHVNTIGRWVKDGRLAAITLPSGRLRFRPEDVNELLTPSTKAS